MQSAQPVNTTVAKNTVANNVVANGAVVNDARTEAEQAKTQAKQQYQADTETMGLLWMRTLLSTEHWHIRDIM